MHGERATNAGMTDSRQINQVIDKSAKGDNRAPTGEEGEDRATLKQHSLKGDRADQ